MELGTLKAPRGAKKRRSRFGLGEGSGHGKTSGRGGKGQTARSGGGVRPGFEGGQMPLSRRLPKFGFTSRTRVLGKNVYAVVNVGDLERFPDGAVVDYAALKSQGYAKGSYAKAGIKVLGEGTLSKKLTVKVQAISAAARTKIEANGGSIEICTLPRQQS